MHIAISILLIMLFVFLMVHLILWLYISSSPFTNIVIRPGDQYTSGQRSYVYPAHLKIQGTVYKLKDEFIETQRILMKKIAKVFSELKIAWWVSGGTLLGATRHGAILPDDDDIDIGTHDENRSILFSSDFTDACEKYGLVSMYFLGSSEFSADRVGGCVRVQVKSGAYCSSCTLDIFFYETYMFNNITYISKLDGWQNDKNIRNTIETYNHTDVLPLNMTSVDGLQMSLPHKPINLLMRQYGDDVMEIVHTRPCLISHATPYTLFRWIFPSRPRLYREPAALKANNTWDDHDGGNSDVETRGK